MKTINEIIIKREQLKNTNIDIGGRDIIIGFNEPALKFSSKKQLLPDIDSKLTPRLITYFLPAINIARMQNLRPRMYVVSGINMALKWNANNENEKKILMINNNLKLDFIKCFFEKFFPDDFSIIEYIVSQDILKIPENKLLELWEKIEKKHLDEIKQIKIDLARFNKPKLFNTNNLTPKAKEYLNSQDEKLLNAFKYAIAHIFALGDINFEGNYIHSPIGYATIGGVQEKTFNKIRYFVLDYLKNNSSDFFGRETIIKDNLKIIIQNETQSPPPYSGALKSKGYKKQELDEVTYENNKNLDFYEKHEKFKYDMKYLYDNFVSKKDYKEFWDEYQMRYFDLKNRHKEAYKLNIDF